MRRIIGVIYSEITKQHQNWFNSISAYFSLLIWPILIFVNAYYCYKPFNVNNGFGSNQNFIIFLLTGFLGYNFFWSMVQSAWQMGFERQTGTLEVVFLSPANRLAIIYGRALGSLVENVWMFSLFCIIILVVNSSFKIASLGSFLAVFIILTVSATVWGGMMNAIFLFSRDATFLFNILDEPMVFFSGVRIPIISFPYIFKAIAIIFPLTHSLNIVRKLIGEPNIINIMPDLIRLLVVLFIIVIVTIILVKLAEKNARKTGELLFY